MKTHKSLLIFTAILLAACGTVAAQEDKKSPIRALLVNGRAAKERFETAAGFLQIALDPFEGKQPDKAMVRPTVVSAARFADLSAEDMKQYDCVFLCDVPRLGKADVERLQAFVRGGGGLVVSLGPGVEVANYNEQLFQDGKGLLPVKLIEKKKAMHLFRLAASAEEYKKPLLVAMGNNPQTLFAAIGFETIMKVSEPDAKTKARVIFSFEEIAKGKDKGDAAGIAMLEWKPFGEKSGRVVLIATTLDRKWNDWPASFTFVAAMNELAIFVAAEPRRGN